MQRPGFVSLKLPESGTVPCFAERTDAEMYRCVLAFLQALCVGVCPSVPSGASSSSVSLAIVERTLGEFVDVPALRVQEQKVEVDTIPQDHVPQDHVLDRLVLLHMNEYNGSSNNSTICQFTRISRRIARTRRCSMCLRRASTNASWSSWEFSLHFSHRKPSR